MRSQKTNNVHKSIVGMRGEEWLSCLVLKPSLERGECRHSVVFKVDSSRDVLVACDNLFAAVVFSQVSTRRGFKPDKWR